MEWIVPLSMQGSFDHPYEADMVNSTQIAAANE